MKKFFDICIILVGVFLVVLWEGYTRAGQSAPWVVRLLFAAVLGYVAYFVVFKRIAGRRERRGAKPSRGNPFPAEMFGGEDLENILESMGFDINFGGNCYHSIRLTKSEAQSGCVRIISYEINKPCEHCDGSGEAVSGSSPTCPICNGEKSLKTTRSTVLGTMETLKPCEGCKGMGIIIENQCKPCGGCGWAKAHEQFEITIPPHFNEKTLEIPDKGNFINKQSRGRLIITIKQERRRGKYESH